MKIEIVRPDDLLNLRIEAINLRLNSDLDPNNLDKPSLVVEDLQQPSYLVVTFPPQTIAERAYFQGGGLDEGKFDDSNRPHLDARKSVDDPQLDMPGQLDQPGTGKPPRLTNALLGHPSRLVFKVPATASIPFSIKELLNWTGLDL